MVPCVGVILVIVIQMLAVFSSRHSQVLGVTGTSGVLVAVVVCEEVAEPIVRLKFSCNNKWRISFNPAFPEFKTRVPFLQ
jgi:hypothetical protein